MLHPSYQDLMEAVNSEVEPGEQPIVQSRYSIVIAAAKRARQLVDGKEPLVASYGKKPLSIAVDELYQQKVHILPPEDETEETGEAAQSDAAAEPETSEAEAV
jgi:DNA-directed RNA polymerase subunit omega